MTKHKNDPKTMLSLSRTMRKMVKDMRESAVSVGKLATEPASGQEFPDRYYDFYSEAALKSYAADVLERVARKLEVTANIKLHPNRKCRSCGGKASVCYPRHLEGRSCA